MNFTEKSVKLCCIVKFKSLYTTKNQHFSTQSNLLTDYLCQEQLKKYLVGFM